MLSTTTRFCPSPLIKCSTTRPAHIHSSKPVLFRRVGFTPRTDLSFRFSHFHEKIFTVNQKRISPENNKAVEVDGLASCTCADELEGWSEKVKKKGSDLLEDWSEEEQKDLIEFFENWSEEEKKEMLEILKGCSKGDLKKLTQVFHFFFKNDTKKFKQHVDGLDKEKVGTKIRDYLRGLSVKEKKGVKNITIILMGLLDVVPRAGFLTNVFCVLASQLLLGSVGYTAMKMNPTIIAALQQNYFYLFSLFTGGLFLLPTLKAFKGMNSVGEKDLLDSIFVGLFHVAMASIGVVLADIHLASSNGIIMVGALAITLTTFGMAIIAALMSFLGKKKDMIDLETNISSSSSVTLIVIASFIQIVNPGPISAAIDVGFNSFIFSLFLFYDVWMILKRYYKDDEYMQASAHLFLDLYGMFIVSLKVLGMLSGLFIFSNKVLGMLYTPGLRKLMMSIASFMSSITTFMK